MHYRTRFLLCSLLLAVQPVLAQDSASKTFLNRRDLVLTAIALGGMVALSHFDTDIARASQKPRFQGSSLHDVSLNISRVNETSLTLAGIATYGIARVFKAQTVTDVALHATESVVLASVVSQLIRGPLGRTRPFVTHDSNQYDFHAFRGFFGDTSFNYRAFPSIHTSSSMAVATVLAMELHRRKPGAARFVGPMLFAAAILPGLARIQLDQHWASDIGAGAFMGVLSGYKVVSYSHDHPDNWFDRKLLAMAVVPDGRGRALLKINHSF